MALERIATDPQIFDIAGFSQDGTQVLRRAQVTGWSHDPLLQTFTITLLLVPYSVMPDGYGAELTGGVFQRQPDRLQATMNRLVDATGRILAERYKGHTATDKEWSDFLAQAEADESVKAYYQYELFRKWCKEPQVIDNLIEGFVLQAYLS